jgi:uncharacterized protein YcbK (DUF882 family)
MSITRNDVITASGSYPERLKSKELTQEVTDNIDKLIIPVNNLLAELGIKSVKISSGFRPSAINAAVANAAKKSAHQSGEAVDIIDDKGQSLAKKITLKLLEKYDLYMEDPAYTIGKNTNWVHLSTRKTRSGKRIFIP